MKIVREHINEKFTEYSDPIHDLEIGKRKIVFDKIWKPLYLDYKNKYGDVLIPKYVKKYFDLFKQQIEPLLIDHYVQGHTWTKHYAGETKFKVYRIMGKGFPLFKYGYFNVEAVGEYSKYLETYAIYLPHVYIISGY